MYMHMREVRSLGTGNIRSCNPPDMDAENQTQIFIKRSCLSTEPPAQLLALVYKRMS